MRAPDCGGLAAAAMRSVSWVALAPKSSVEGLATTGVLSTGSEAADLLLVKLPG